MKLFNKFIALSRVNRIVETVDKKLAFSFRTRCIIYHFNQKKGEIAQLIKINFFQVTI